MNLSKFNPFRWIWPKPIVVIGKMNLQDFEAMMRHAIQECRCDQEIDNCIELLKNNTQETPAYGKMRHRLDMLILMKRWNISGRRTAIIIAKP